MIAAAYKTQQQEDDGYESFLGSMRTRFQLVTAHTPHLFTTDAQGLFFEFLGALPTDKRQHYTCHACRRFVERFGGLVSLDAGGNARPVMWDTEAAPGLFVDAVEKIDRAVRRAKVTGVFFTDANVWGEPNTGPWNHMAVIPRATVLHKPTRLLTNGQQMSEKVQDYETLRRGLSEFSIEHIRKANALLESEALYRSEKVLGVAKWLLDLQERMNAVKDRRAEANIAWLAVATAPPGFCHVRSTMIGTLLEDIAAGKDFGDVSRAFAAKMHPLQYQRPTAPVSDGQIAAAEKVIETLKSAGALERRFARIEDITCVWKPPFIVHAEKRSGGVFDHLRRTAGEQPTDLGAPAKSMTWQVFARDVLPKAERIEYLVPHERTGFFAFVTAANPDAPPIIQWDREGKRNAVTWYVYNNGSYAAAWNLRPAEWNAVTGIALSPHRWDIERTYSNHGNQVAFLLDGARDVNYERTGGLFPELLKSEYHAIRHVIEAHVARSTIVGKDDATACGVLFSAGNTQWVNTFRVTAGGVRTAYRIDRWE